MQDLAKKVRKHILEMIYRVKGPHIGGSLSCVEILIALYFKVLLPEDKFILSKGHACPALYAVLFEKGLIDSLDKFAVDGGSLESHPRRNTDLGIELTTGSLGMGLSVAAGMAKARKTRVFVLLSDGDLEEGSTWEAMMFSSHHNLNNLIAVIDYNKLQALGKMKDIMSLEPLREKIEAFGWKVKEVDGHNIDNIVSSLENQSSRPLAVIAHTKKGKGISFMEDNPVWHSKCPNEEEYNKALEELK